MSATGRERRRYEQSEGINQVTLAIHQLDQVIQQNAAATEELSSTATELSSQADSMMQTARFFKIKTPAAGFTPLSPASQEHEHKGKNGKNGKNGRHIDAASMVPQPRGFTRGIELNLLDADDTEEFIRQ